MKNTKYTVKPTTQFKKDYKLAVKRGLDIKLLEDVITDLAMGIPLPEKNRDHALSGNWTGHRECHILPDWLFSTAHGITEKSNASASFSSSSSPMPKVPPQTSPTTLTVTKDFSLSAMISAFVVPFVASSKFSPFSVV